jgi:predicted amidophosphoribosyltransferase
MDVAAESYVSPRERALTPREAHVREVSIALKYDEPWAIEEAIRVMAPLVPGQCFLVPVPGSKTGSLANHELARELAKRTGAIYASVLDRFVPVESSRDRRRAGGSGHSARYHAATIRLSRGVGQGAKVVLVDNVIVSGATIKGCRLVLGMPEALGLAYASGDERLISR